MRFTNNGRWWSRAAAGENYSLDGRWLPLLALGGLVMMLILSAWRFSPALHGATAGPGLAYTDAVPADFQQLPAVHIRLRADAAGRLASIALNGRPVRDIDDLRLQIHAFLGPASDATVEAELDCDGNLRYQDTQQLIAAISTRAAADGQSVVPFVDRVTFLPQRKGKR